MLRRNGHHLAAAPREGAHIAIDDIIDFEHFGFRRHQRLDGIGNRKANQLRGTVQPLGMLAVFENFSGIAALALEHAGAIMQPMR